MSFIHNFTGEPIQVRLLNGKLADFPAEESPLIIKDKQPMRKIVTLLDDNNELVIHGNTVSISGENGFPPIKPDTYYIVTKEVVNALRKIQRGASDLLIPIKTRAGYYDLHFANIITELNEDECTSKFVRQTWRNSLPPVEIDKYESIETTVSNR